MRAFLSECLESPGLAQRLEAHALPSSYRNQLSDYVIDIALWIFSTWEDRGRSCFILGLAGSQGSGKSTLASFLDFFLRALGLRVMILGIDDLYLSREGRLLLAESVHPLFQTRGVPGTHEVDLAARLFEEARAGSRELLWPRFDKACDDRAEDSHQFEGPVDVLLFEGWCVGCPPLDPASLEAPINELERLEDESGHWRRAIQESLEGSYRRLFDDLDSMIFLQAPSFEAVFKWRQLQERKLGQSLGPKNHQNLRLLDDIQLRRFLQHYERLTRHMLDTLPLSADLVLELGENQRGRKLRRR